MNNNESRKSWNWRHPVVETQREEKMLFSQTDLISSYSRKQAIEDGVLIDLNQIISIKESGFKFPIACTSAVWDIINRAVRSKTCSNDFQGVVWDIMWLLRLTIQARIRKNMNTDIVYFSVIINGVGRKKKYMFKALCGPGDQGEPVLTILLPDED